MKKIDSLFNRYFNQIILTLTLGFFGWLSVTVHKTSITVAVLNEKFKTTETNKKEVEKHSLFITNSLLIHLEHNLRIANLEKHKK